MRQRVAAYAVCEQEGQILLARWISRDGTSRHWTLPGGGIEHHEDPFDAVVREVAEETGYEAVVERLLGVDSRGRIVNGEDLHHLGVFYQVRIIGGALRNETGGSTDLAAWLPVGDVAGLERASLVDVGLELARLQPPHGHVPAITVDGLLRH